MDYSIIKERANCVAPTNERITKMSKDEKDSKKVLQEISFDSWDANGSPITINTTDYLSPHGTDTITVNTADIEAGSNGTIQGDLFNGWPADGEPQIVTVTLDDIKTED